MWVLLLKQRLAFHQCRKLKPSFGLTVYGIGNVVQLNTFKGRSRDFDESNSGKYVIAKVERTFYSGDDRMGTALTLVTDSPGS